MTSNITKTVFLLSSILITDNIFCDYPQKDGLQIGLYNNESYIINQKSMLRRKEDDYIVYELEAHSDEANREYRISGAGSWYWVYAPDEIRIRINENKEADEVTFTYKNRFPNLNSDNDETNRHIKYGSFMSFICLYYTDESFAGLFIKNHDVFRPVRSGIIGHKDAFDGKTVIMSFDNLFHQEMLVRAFDALSYNNFEREDISTSFLDFPSVPDDKGMLGRRQRLWRIKHEELGTSVVVMDLKTRTPRFGRELLPQVDEYLLYSKFSMFELKETAFQPIINNLLRLPHVTPPGPVAEHSSFIDDKILQEEWKWNIEFLYNGNEIKGEVVDVNGGFAWLRRPLQYTNRVIKFNWFTENLKPSADNAIIPLLSSATFHRSVDSVKVEFYFMQGQLNEVDELRLHEHVGLYLSLFFSGGFFDFATHSVYVDKEVPELESTNRLQGILLYVFDDADPSNLIKSIELNEVFPDKFVWTRRYRLDLGIKYDFVSEPFKIGFNTYRLYRYGDYGVLGFNSAVPKFWFSPFVGVNLTGDGATADRMRLSMERVNPPPNRIAEYFDYLDRPRLISQQTASIMEKRDSIEKSVAEKLSREDRNRVLTHINLINMAKQRWIMENGLKVNRTLSWDDIMAFLPISHEELHSPLGYSYQIGLVNENATYGYD